VISEAISIEEKHQALERVLASHTLSRSDQIRALLRFICEAEFEGRAHELNEYALGVSVLGRPSDYSPSEDSCVRTRAYELRNKLKSYYEEEAPDDPLRIEIRKGAYIPQFQRAPRSARRNANANALEETALTLAPRGSRVPGAGRYWAMGGFAALVFLAYFTFTLARRDAGKAQLDTPAWTPELAALWGPFLSKEVPLTISYEKRVFFFSPGTGLVVRDYQVNHPGEESKSQPLAGFRLKMKASELRETFDYTDYGSVHAAFLLGGLLTPRRREIGLKEAGSLGWEDIRNGNIIFIGKPTLNPSIRYSLQSGDFVESADGGAVRNLHPLPGEPSEYPNATTHGLGEKYALITVIPGPNPAHRIMVLSGAGSEFMWALAEYVTYPSYVKEMMTHLRQPSGDYPSAFQVLIRARFESYVPVYIGYVTHRILKS